MISFIIQLAELNVCVNALYDSTKKYCSEYLTGEKPDFSVSINENDIIYEQDQSYKHTPDVRYSAEYLETVAVYRKIAEKMPEYDTILFHGSVLALEGCAYMFTAGSGTGKSTHARLWREAFGSRVVMINDDKPLLKITDTGVTAYGTPWNGKHCLGSNTSAPLKAVCILSRAEQNSIEPITKCAAWQYLYTQTYRPKSMNAAKKTLMLTDKLANGVRLYSLHCNTHTSAALTAYNAIKEQNT